MEPRRPWLTQLLTWLLMAVLALMTAVAVDMGAMSLEVGFVIIVALGAVMGLIKLDMYR